MALCNSLITPARPHDSGHGGRVTLTVLAGMIAAGGFLVAVSLHDDLINLALRESYIITGTETPAFWAFMSCYVAAALLTWARYVRPQRPAGAPDLEAIAEQPVSS